MQIAKTIRFVIFALLFKVSPDRSQVFNSLPCFRTIVSCGNEAKKIVIIALCAKEP